MAEAEPDPARRDRTDLRFMKQVYAPGICTRLDPVNNPLRQVHYHPHFTVEETEAKRRKYIA